MQTEPIKDYIPPEYPEADKIKDKKKFLAGCIPDKWKKVIITAGAVVLISGSLMLHDSQKSCCIKESAGSCFVEATQQNAAHIWESLSGKFDSIFNKNKYAGILGDIVLPDQKRETDVRRAVEEEFLKQGIVFDDSSYNAGDDNTPLYLDSFSSKDRIGYKFIDTENRSEIAKWGNIKEGTLITLKDNADFLEKELLKQKQIKCAVIIVPVKLKLPVLFLPNADKELESFKKTIRVPEK
ncbi:MAG: hypothetical protein LWY06_18570 [Firmicutes bacterium]|nr:hypothetical protein [Bacillota bacterium]